MAVAAEPLFFDLKVKVTTAVIYTKFFFLILLTSHTKDGIDGDVKLTINFVCPKCIELSTFLYPIDRISET